MGSEWNDGPRSPMDTGGGRAEARGGNPPGRGGSGRRPPTNRRGGGGGSGGNTGGTRHKGGTSSSSVHDGIRILVVGMASAVVTVGAGVAAFLAHGYGVFG